MTDEDTLQTLQRMFDALYRDAPVVPRWRILQHVELMDVAEDVRALFDLLPPGLYTRPRLADQLNSVIVGHGMGRSLGTVE